MAVGRLVLAFVVALGIAGCSAMSGETKIEPSSSSGSPILNRTSPGEAPAEAK